MPDTRANESNAIRRRHDEGQNATHKMLCEMKDWKG